MPVSEALRRLSEDPGFWTGDRVADPDADDGRELQVSFPVTGGYALVLALYLLTGERTFGLRTPATSEPVQLGWSAADGPYPAALRPWELDLFGRVIALGDPTLPHPGLVVALLAPFAPATADDDETEVAALHEAAYRSLRRPVPEPAPNGPEQTPLPLFASADWWPSPPPISPQVLDEAAIAALTLPARARLEVRTSSRYPKEQIADLVRRSTALLHTLPTRPPYSDARPLARHITTSGDLRAVRDLLGTLTEAGCDHPTVLDALSEPLVTAEACWMVETLAGAEPGTLLRRQL